MLDLFAVALRALEGGRGVAIATVIGAQGSTPRHLGARMVVADDGQQWGTVGGGKIEQLVAAASREVAGGAPPRVVRQHLVRDLAMCCGGSMEVVVTPVTREMVAPAVGAHVRGLTIETPLDGGAFEVRAARAGDPRRHQATLVGERLIERLGGGERVVVFGFGHVARALGPLLEKLGFEVVACDDNETGAVAASPGWTRRVIESFDAHEVERELGGFDDDYVLIVTRDHAIDQALLERLLDRPGIAYLGMIGSRGKVGRFRKRLEAKGLLDEARWARLRAPIGFDIGAETPDEIAVAIAAELIAFRRLGETRAGDWSPRKP